MSSGERQMLALSRVYIQAPHFVLEEASKGLAP
jgi:ABC-type branched-subunit amino acid transport system ATPase component